MIIRKDTLVNNNVYHILNKSISGFKIFNNESDFFRFIDLMKFCRNNFDISYSYFNKFSDSDKEKYYKEHSHNPLVDIIAYCIMPTHIHLLLKQLLENGITIFTGNIENSYAKYFNISHERKGPLWEGRFKNVLVKDERQLYHLTRYIHLNPVSAGLINKPEDWLASSYPEFTNDPKISTDRICNFGEIMNIKPHIYKKFVEDRISYQKQLSKIKKIILE